jgi:hypothetical protein
VSSCDGNITSVIMWRIINGINISGRLLMYFGDAPLLQRKRTCFQIILIYPYRRSRGAPAT